LTDSIPLFKQHLVTYLFSHAKSIYTNISDFVYQDPMLPSVMEVTFKK